jgi:hypothetical protein
MIITFQLLLPADDVRESMFIAINREMLYTIIQAAHHSEMCITQTLESALFPMIY